MSLRSLHSTRQTDMDRRTFIACMSLMTVAAPVTGEAKPEKSCRIGMLSPHKAPAGPVSSPFMTRLAGLGWKVEYVWRHADGHVDRLPRLAADLVRLKVDLILTDGTYSTKAAKDATATIPVVFVGVSFPVEAGVVESLARPGGNVTGATDQTGDLQAKLIELIAETVPGISRVGAISDFTGPGFPFHSTEQLDGVAQRRGLTMVRRYVQRVEDLDAAFATFSRERVGALIAHLTPFILAERARLGQLALQNRMPTFAMGRGMIDAGFLMSYHPDWSDVLVQAANQVDRVLRGAKPATLPVVQPTRFELVINTRTAASLGLTIPSSVLARADELAR